MQHARAPRTLFDEILRQLQARQFDRAITSCRDALLTFPEDINILGLLGAALGDKGQLEEAEKVLNQVIDLAPTFAKPYEDLGTLLLRQDKVNEALPLLEKAVRLDPKLEDAHFHLGRALAMQGRGAEADESFERSFALSPLRRLMALAAEHHKAGPGRGTPQGRKDEGGGAAVSPGIAEEARSRRCPAHAWLDCRSSRGPRRSGVPSAPGTGSRPGSHTGGWAVC
jgi:Flp pilus assembly protein TadD